MICMLSNSDVESCNDTSNFHQGKKDRMVCDHTGQWLTNAQLVGAVESRTAFLQRDKTLLMSVLDMTLSNRMMKLQ